MEGNNTLRPATKARRADHDPPTTARPRQALPRPVTALFDLRHTELIEPLFLGELLAHGRRTATAWFRAGGITDDFRRAYTVLGTPGHFRRVFPAPPPLGKGRPPAAAAALFRALRRTIDPGPRWLIALDDTPTQRYGPEVEGAGLHHNPTPGPAQQKFLYGHIWVTTAWVVQHPQWHTLALPLLADLYIRAKDLPT